MSLPVEVVVGKGFPDSRYSPSEVTLYGIPLTQLSAYIGKTTQVIPTPVLVNITPNCATVRFYPALISAYAYQSHCYNMPEPAILIVQGPLVKAVGFGFEQMDQSTPPVNITSYYMWKFDKLDRTMQFEMTSDTLEEIILKRGLAGTKQPIAYASRAALSHRGGRLSE
jgi:hypothetical protein